MRTVKGFGRTGELMQAIVPDWPADVALLPWQDKVSTVCRNKQEAAELVRYFGHPDFAPVLPVLLCVPGGWGQLAGMGIAPASELRDEAVARWELQENKIAKTGSTFDFDEAREKAGLMPRDKVDAAVRNAFRDKIAQHKATSVTNSGYTLVYPRWMGKTVHPVADPESWRN